MKVAVVGATGLVGNKMLQVLEEREFQIDELILAASEKSVGKTLTFRGRDIACCSVQDAVDAKPDIALFSAGGATSLEWAPKFAEVGSTVIDNSSAWRMDENCPLVVPEVNGTTVNSSHKIIANPNCSTIQLVMALKPLHDAYGIKRLVISTYQSVSGTGVKAVEQMERERDGANGVMAYPHPIDRNCLPHCDSFLENDYTKEEMKLVHETRKILGDQDIQVTATAVRVPVAGGHSESVNIEFKNDFDITEVKQLLDNMSGVKVQDNPAQNEYPMPLNAHETDLVYVGRIRRDESQPNSMNCWIVSDNLRKGAATNAVQIAEFLRMQALV